MFACLCPAHARNRQFLDGQGMLTRTAGGRRQGLERRRSGCGVRGKSVDGVNVMVESAKTVCPQILGQWNSSKRWLGVKQWLVQTVFWCKPWLV